MRVVWLVRYAVASLLGVQPLREIDEAALPDTSAPRRVKPWIFDNRCRK